MKFGHTWPSLISSLPQSLQESCFNYKNYKKLAKSSLPLTTLYQTLTSDASRVDSAIRDSQKSIKPIKFLLCRHDSSTPSSLYLPVDVKYEYAKLNTQCLYKICKRLDKKRNTNVFMNWFTTVRTTHDYTFLSNMNHTRFQIEKDHKPPSECPICFDSEMNSYLVLACGHIVCTPCSLSMLDVAKANGTMDNRIAHGRFYNPRRANCPICRDQNAFNTYIVFDQ